MDLTYTQDPQNKYNLRMRTDRGGWGRGGGGDTLIHNAEYACILQSSDTMEVLCAAIKAVMQARNHVKKIFHHPFRLSGRALVATLCSSLLATAFHFRAVFLGIVDCVVIKETSVN